MAEVEMVAIKDFSYATRRLRAGDRFMVSERDAKILRAIKKADMQREPGKVPAPPRRVIEQAAAVTPSKPVPAVSTRSTSTRRTGRRRKSVANKG